MLNKRQLWIGCCFGNHHPALCQERLKIITPTVVNAREGGYHFEPSAIDLIVRFVERYLAEFRNVLR